jgi:hypothetical protein
MAEAGLCRKPVVLDETPWHEWPAGNFNSPETLPLVAQLGQGLFAVRLTLNHGTRRPPAQP